MVKFWALGVTVLTTLGVAGHLIAQEAPQERPNEAAESGEPAELVDKASTVVRVHHVDEFTQAAALRYPGLKAASSDLAAAQARLDEARLSPFFQFEGQARFWVAPGARGTDATEAAEPASQRDSASAQQHGEAVAAGG